MTKKAVGEPFAIRSLKWYVPEKVSETDPRASREHTTTSTEFLPFSEVPDVEMVLEFNVALVDECSECFLRPEANKEDFRAVAYF